MKHSAPSRLSVCILAFVMLHLTVGILHAQVPQLLNYQGRVAVGTVNFDGTGAFKFALVNTDGTMTYWSNDGTSTAGSEPTAAVSLTVTKGLYSVLLGDTTLANMTVIPPTVFDNVDVRLRVWFNDGTNGSQLLTPDQRIAPAGYAMRAGNVQDGAITSAKIAAGAVGSTQLGTGAVQSGNIADGAVMTDKLADGAVTIPKFSPGYLSANTDIFSAGQPYTSAQTGELTYSKTFDVPFATGTTPEVILPEGWVLDAAATETGFSATATFAPVLVDDGDYNPPASKHNVGEYSSLAKIDGRPAIAYRDTTSNDLKYVIATDATGTAWSAPVTVEAAGSSGASVSLAVIGGRPAISYWVAGTTNKLKFAIATDASGSSWAFTNVLDSDYPFGRTSLAIVNGFPAIATTVGNAIDTKRALTYFIAATADGSGAWTTVTVDSTTDAGSRTSLAVVNGNPAISYVDTVNSKLRYIRADDPLGATWPAGPNLNVADTAPATGTCSMAIIEGHPAIAFREDLTSAGDTGYVRALDADGATWGPVKTANSAGQSGSISLSVIAGRPAICSTLTASSYGLRFAVAMDTTGANWTNMQVVAPPSGSLFLRDVSLMDLNGRAAVCYSHQSGGGLWFMLLPDFPDWSASSGEVHPFLAARSAGVTDGAITSASIASGAVGSAQLGMGAVQSGNIAAGAVTTTQIANGAVGSAQLAAGAAADNLSAGGMLNITSDGLVGIGTETPEAGLHIRRGGVDLLSVLKDGVGGFNELDFTRGIAISGTTAYVVSGSDRSLTIIDVSDPASPALLAVLKDGVGGFNELDGAYDVAVSGTTAYVASEADDSLTIIDVSDPASPALLAVLKDGVGGFNELDGAWGVTVSGTIAYLASGLDDSLTIIDVSDPASPALLAVLKDGVGGFNELNGAHNIAVSGTTAYVVSSIDNSLTIIDVSDPASPTLLAVLKDGVGGFNALSGAYDVAVSGTTAYLTSFNEASLTIIDVSAPASPALLAVLKDGVGGFNELNGAVRIAVSGTTAYLTSFFDASLTIIDVSDPASPALLAVLKDGLDGFNELNGAFDVAVSGTTAYVTSSTDDSLTIINVSTAGTPGLIVDDRVGIGTTTPQSELDVNGTVTATTFSGSGAGLTNLAGSNIVNGSITVDKLAPGAANDADSDPTNELQTLSLGGNDLTLSGGGGTVNLSGAGPWTWNGGNVYRSSGRVGIGTNAPGATLDVAGTIRATGFRTEESVTPSSINVIGGFNLNYVSSYSKGGVISGGGESGALNAIGNDADFASIGGGSGNVIEGITNIFNQVYRSDNSVIGGGLGNEISASRFATVGGGRENVVAPYSYGATVGGGYANTVAGNNATVSGGSSNTATGSYATISGGLSNEANGQYSFAAGRRAHADHDGAFVWGDSTDADFSSTAANQFLIRAGGGVGIGTNSPDAPLHVDGFNERTWNATYFGYNYSALTTAASTISMVSIKASNEVVASYFTAISDRRIKSIEGLSDSAADLELIRAIEITDYHFKDPVEKGSRSQKKVIAQQVEEVFPQAVSRTTGVVPDIFREAPIKDGWVSLATDLKPGERVRLITEQGHRAVHEVLEVGKDRFRTDFTEDAGRVFVYGREVDDFRSVDYEAISMLNVSATQELAKRLEKAEAENAELKQRLARQAKELAALQQIEARLAKLERASGAAAPVKVAVKK